MAGSSMTFSHDAGNDYTGRPGGVRRLIADWVSDDTTGAVSGVSPKICGELLKAVTDPGSEAPTDNYDITVTDAEGANVLAGCFDDLADRDTSNSETVQLFLNDGSASVGARPVVCSPLTIAVANAGNSKNGRLVLYYR